MENHHVFVGKSTFSKGHFNRRAQNDQRLDNMVNSPWLSRFSAFSISFFWEKQFSDPTNIYSKWYPMHISVAQTLLTTQVYPMIHPLLMVVILIISCIPVISSLDTPMIFNISHDISLLDHKCRYPLFKTRFPIKISRETNPLIFVTCVYCYNSSNSVFKKFLGPGYIDPN